MKGVNFDLLNSLDSNINCTIKNLRQKGLKKDAYSLMNRCSQQIILDWEHLTNKYQVYLFLYPILYYAIKHNICKKDFVSF